MSDDDYFAHPALSQSLLKKYLISPAKAKSAVFDIAESSKAFGAALEVLIVDGEEALNNQYSISKFKTYCQSMAKERLETGKKMLTAEHFEQLIYLKDSFGQSANAARLIKAKGFNQVVIFFELDGIKCKAKLDKIIETDEGIIVVDYKSFAAKGVIDARTLSNHCRTYQYHIQAQFYIKAVCAATGLHEDQVSFINIFIEKDINPEIAAPTIAQSKLDIADTKIEYALRVYKEAQEKNLYPNLEEMMLRQQNVLSDQQSTILTLDWYEEEFFPEVLL
jgi:hypothetical protein